MMDSLKKVCLENNAIGDGGATALSKALEDNDTLLSIHLESNNISRTGACSLGEMLSNKYKLSKLNLNNNPIGDEGFSKIAEGLAEIETLRIITLANTEITKVSIPSLSQSLKNKQVLATPSESLGDGKYSIYSGGFRVRPRLTSQEKLGNLGLRGNKLTVESPLNRAAVSMIQIRP